MPVTTSKNLIKIAVPLVLLAAATLLAYFASLQNGFISTWDDTIYVLENPYVRALTWDNFAAVFSRTFEGNYAPLHILGYMFQYRLAGLDPFVFHIVSLLLHTVSGVMVYALVIRLSGRQVTAFFTSFVFLLHPVQVESVAWITEQKNLLAVGFMLAAFHCYISSTSAPRAIRSPWFWAAFFLFVCALLSKALAVVTPLIFLLYDMVYRRNPPRWKALFLEKIVFFVPAIAIAAITILYQSHEHGGGRTGLYGGTILSHVMQVLPVFLRYLGLIFRPTNLNIIYEAGRFSIPFESILSGVTLCLFTLLMVLCYRKRRDLFFWLAVYIVGLLPVSQIVPLNTLINDRYLYLPLIGMAGFLGTLAADFLGSSRLPVKALSLIILLPAMFLPFMTAERAAVWESNISLWNDARSKEPESVQILSCLAISYQKQGYYKIAVALYERALSYDPDRLAIRNDLALLLIADKQFDRAREMIFSTIKANPRDERSFIALGTGYLHEGFLDEAERALAKALLLRPESPRALSTLAKVRMQQGRFPEARGLLERADKAGAELSELTFYLSCLEAADGNHGKALEYLAKALKLRYRDKSWIESNPWMDSLRTTQEYKDLMYLYFSASSK